MSIEPKYYDNFLEEHIQLIDFQLREVSWKYDYDSVKNDQQTLTTSLWIHDEGELENFGYDISVIWNQIKNKFPEYKLERIPYLVSLHTLMV